MAWFKKKSWLQIAQTTSWSGVISFTGSTHFSMPIIKNKNGSCTDNDGSVNQENRHSYLRGNVSSFRVWFGIFGIRVLGFIGTRFSFYLNNSGDYVDTANDEGNSRNNKIYYARWPTVDPIQQTFMTCMCWALEMFVEEHIVFWMPIELPLQPTAVEFKPFFTGSCTSFNLKPYRRCVCIITLTAIIPTVILMASFFVR